MVREMIAAKQKDVPAANEGEKPKKGLSQSSIRNILAPMRGMYNQAIDDGDAHMNPGARVGKFNRRKGTGSGINPLNREELQTVLKTAKEKLPADYPLFLCAPRTGIREGELIALKGIDIDFKSRFINVQRTLSRGKITSPKNGKSRRVDMSQQLTEVLQEHLSQKKAAALRKEMKKPAGDRRDAAAIVNAVMEDWLFTTSTGTQLDPSNLRKVFYKLLTDAKVRRVRFHDLRHTFASLLLQRGESPVYVKEQCGHSSIKVTVDTYGHLIPGGNRQAVDRLDEIVVNNETDSATAAG